MKESIIFLFCLFSLSVYSQEISNSKEPIIFGELLLGGAGEVKGEGGFLYGVTLNYQHENDLFSIRLLEFLQLEWDWEFFLIPIVKEKISQKEIALLYGKRWIYDNYSLSASGGVSWNNYSDNLMNNGNKRVDTNYLGFPLELNFKLFKSRKERYRIIYGMIPIGKPTSFGRSFGFKLVGNISKNSFIGFGVTIGLGIHKKY